MKRAYSILEIKSVNTDANGKRTFTGIASTPTTDRMGDIVEPKGAQFTLPIPFLWQHDSRQPIGWITKAKVTDKGIEVEGEVADIPEEGSLKEKLTEAWQYIKNKLVRGLSIGFDPLESAQIEGTWGYRYTKWDWLELSAVTIPANADASITAIKSIDRELLAASGRREKGVVRLEKTPGASGSNVATPPKPQEGKKMNTQEKIKQFKDARALKAKRMDEIMDAAGESTLDAAQEEEYDTLKGEIETIDKHLERLEAHEKSVAARATVVPTPAAQPAIARATPAEVARHGSSARTGETISLEKKLAPGILFARYAGIMAAAKGSASDAQILAKQFFPNDSTLHGIIAAHSRIKSDIETGRFMKSAVDIGTTTDSDYAAPLVNYQYAVNEFIEFLRPKTILGRIPGLRKVPFNISVPRVLTGGSASWVGESKPKPVTSTTLDAVTLRFKKIATIAVISDELARFSQPDAELVIRDILAGAVVQQMDSDFVDPNNSGTSNVKPASILNGASSIVTDGDTEAAVRNDLRRLLALFRAANQSTSDAVWLMSETNADGLALLTNALGQPAFPSMDSDSPTFRRRPVIASEAMGTNVALVKASEILVADDGQVTIDTSREASVQMNSAPDDPVSASTVMVSLWQQNLLGIKAERFIDWTKARSTSTAYITGVEWGLEST